MDEARLLRVLEVFTKMCSLDKEQAQLFEKLVKSNGNPKAIGSALMAQGFNEEINKKYLEKIWEWKNAMEAL